MNAPTTDRRTETAGRRLPVVAVLAAALVALGTTTAPVARAQTTAVPAAFSAIARADVAAVELVTPQAPVVSLGSGQILYATPATAMAEIGTLTGSNAFASGPYPGDLVVGLPGVVNGLARPPVPAPNYPTYVASSHPTSSESRLEAGPYSIAAESSAERSHADARVGLSTTPPAVVSGRAEATAAREPRTGVVAAEAISTTDPVAFADGLLVVGEIRSSAKVRYDPTEPGAPAVESSLAIGRISVAGIAVGLDEEGLSVGDASPLPVDVAALEQFLSSAGLSLTYVPGERTATSVTTASVKISTTQTVPGVGPTTVNLILGLVSAGARAEVDGSPSVVPPPAVDDEVPPGGRSSAGIGPPVGRAPQGGVTTVAELSAPIRPSNRRAPQPIVDLSPLYPALALAAAAALAASRIRRNGLQQET